MDLNKEDEWCEKCGYEFAELKYEDKKYCPDCILEELESSGEIESTSFTTKIYSSGKGDYIGDDFEGVDELINTLLININGLEEI